MFLLSICVLGLGIAAKPPVTQVKVAAPKIDYKTFPAGRAPMHAKGMGEGEAGLCHTEISCKIGVAAEAPGNAESETHAMLHSVAFDISAKITVWCQEGYTAEILAHEETHRAISEHYYALAHKVAQRLADEAIARKLPLPGSPKAQVLDRALVQLQAELLDEFMRQTNQRSEHAQDRFDAITDHGRNAVANEDAKAQALRDEAEHWVKTESGKWTEE